MKRKMERSLPENEAEEHPMILQKNKLKGMFGRTILPNLYVRKASKKEEHISGRVV